jgi:hypothetical protein
LYINAPKYNTQQKYPIPSRELTDFQKVHPSPIGYLVFQKFSVITESEHSLPISLQTFFPSLPNVPKSTEKENIILLL